MTPPPGVRHDVAVTSVGGGTEAHGGRARLTFSPQEMTLRVPLGVSVFDAASWNGIAIDSTCGGHGTCGKCRVRIGSGAAPATDFDTRSLSASELRDGWRLACLARTTGDLDVEVPPLSTRPKAATVGVGRQVVLRPAVRKRLLELEEPSLGDQRGDLQRVTDAMPDLSLRVDMAVLRGLGRTLRASDYRVTAVVVDDELLDVEPGDTTARVHGMAFDVGTTTVVATLLDLSTGTPTGARSMLNAQQPFGADVISRISATMLDPDALERLRGHVHATMSALAAEVCAEAGIVPDEVYEIAVAGNVTMVQLALGIDPEPVGVAPFIVATDHYTGLRATDFGLALHPRAPAIVFPALGAYVGGDIVAGMLATGMDRDRRLRLLIDVGTNCEIVIGSAERLLACAAPAGPAFEGGQIRCGMRAAEGAIEAVALTPPGPGATDVALQVIGDCAPLGLCGSGLVDAVAALVDLGLVDGSGRFVSDAEARRLVPGLADRLASVGQERVFVLHWWGDVGDVGSSVYLSQRDVRELQFAKASISTGWRLLVEELGVAESDIAQVLLAGSFGTYLSPRAAVRIGLVPKLPLVRIVSAGNVAGEGAKMALLSASERAGAASVVRHVQYVELSDRPDFNDRFVHELAFPG